MHALCDTVAFPRLEEFFLEVENLQTLDIS